MTIAESKQRPRIPVVHTPDVQTGVESIRRRVLGAITTARTNVTPLIEQMPGTMRATRAAAHGMTVALQRLPDSTLRWLAAGSVGLGAGLHLAGAPRLVTAAGVTPALAIAAAIALRPIEAKTTPRPRRSARPAGARSQGGTPRPERPGLRHPRPVSPVPALSAFARSAPALTTNAIAVDPDLIQGARRTDRSNQ